MSGSFYSFRYFGSIFQIPPTRLNLRYGRRSSRIFVISFFYSETLHCLVVTTVEGHNSVFLRFIIRPESIDCKKTSPDWISLLLLTITVYRLRSGYFPSFVHTMESELHRPLPNTFLTLNWTRRGEVKNEKFNTLRNSYPKPPTYHEFILSIMNRIWWQIIYDVCDTSSRNIRTRMSKDVKKILNLWSKRRF